MEKNEQFLRLLAQKAGKLIWNYETYNNLGCLCTLIGKITVRVIRNHDRIDLVDFDRDLDIGLNQGSLAIERRAAIEAVQAAYEGKAELYLQQALADLRKL